MDERYAVPDHIERECAEALKGCVYRLYEDIKKARKLEHQEGSAIESVCLDPKFIPVLDSAYRFLVHRNMDRCRGKLLLDMGCKVGLVISEAQKQMLSPYVLQVVEIKFEALMVISALIVELFLIEVDRKAIDLDVDEVHLMGLKKFLESIPATAIRAVQETRLDEIAVAHFYALPHDVPIRPQ